MSVFTTSTRALGMAFIALLSVTPAHSLESATEYRNGLWWQGDSFVEQSWYVVNGRLQQQKPETISYTVDLKQQFVIAPFADAHNHNLQNPWLAQRFSQSYKQAGILYGLMMCSNGNVKAQTEAALADTSLSIELATACVTSSDGHPVRMALQPAGDGSEPPKPEDVYDKSVIIIDTPAQITEKWPLIQASQTKIVKLILVHSEDQSRRDNENFFGVNGLTPEVVQELVPYLQEQGLRVAAHVESAADFEVAVNAGVDILAHLPGYNWWKGKTADHYRLSDAAIASAAEQNITLITTTSVVDLFTNTSAERKQQIQALQKENLSRLRAAGVPLILGSDRFDANVLTEYSYLTDMQLFEPAELLNMLTRDTARAIFPDRKIGEFRNGYEANFLVLAENPLEQSQAVKNVVMKVKQGEILK